MLIHGKYPLDIFVDISDHAGKALGALPRQFLCAWVLCRLHCMHGHTHGQAGYASIIAVLLGLFHRVAEPSRYISERT